MDFKDKNDWFHDFNEFSSVDSDKVQVSEAAYRRIKNRLFPHPGMVFGKVVLIHTVVGSLSFAACHQFGLNPFRTQTSLMDLFMRIGGHSFCMIFCGIFFMSITYLLANLFLNLEELETIKRHKLRQTGIMGMVSLVAFHFFGAQLVATFAFLWIVGALIGGLVSIEGSYRVRRVLAGAWP